MKERIAILFDFFSDNICTVFAVMAVVILFFCGGRKYLNIWGIIKCYINDFIKDNIIIGLALFISPILFSFSICLSRSITDADIEIITVAISILMALFFSFLTSFNEIKKNIQENEKDYSEYTQHMKVLNESISIVSYEILLSVIILICCFIFSFVYNLLFNVFIYSLYIHLLLNLLLLLKRFNKQTTKDSQ